MIEHNTEQPNEGSPEQRSLFLHANTLGHACCVSTTIRLALEVFPQEIPRELIQTARDVETDVRILVELGSDALLGPRLADAVQVIGYMGIACGQAVTYINTERRRRSQLTSEQQEVARLASIAAATAAAQADDRQRQISLHMARMSGGDPRAAAILRRSDCYRNRGF